MVLPLRDINTRRTFPIVTITFIVINFLAFFYELALGERLQDFFLTSAFIPERFFQSGGWITQAQPILVSMFLHGGWAHILGNMLYLWIFGDNVEDRLGHVLYAVIYLLFGVAATLAHAYSNPSSTVPSIGASGAIAGVLGAYFVMFPRARVLTVIPLGFFIRIAELPAIAVLGLWFVMQLFSGSLALGAQTAQSAGVAWWAHIGGFAVGMLVGALFRGPRPPSRMPRSAFPLAVFLLVPGSAAAQILIPTQHFDKLTFELHAVRDDVTLYIGEPAEFLRLDTRPLGFPPRYELSSAAQSALLRIRDVTLFDTPPPLDQTYVNGELELEEEQESLPQKQEWIVRLFPSGATKFFLQCDGGKGDFDFTDLPVEDVYVKGDSAEFKIEFSRPNRTDLERFKLTAIGGSLKFYDLLNAHARSMTLQLPRTNTEIDITGKPAAGKGELYLEDVPNRLHVRVSKKIGLRVEGAAQSVARFDADHMELEQAGAGLVSRGFDDKPYQLRLHIASPVPNLEVEWD